MDIDIIITFPPISILLAIAVSPESLHILTANSVNNAIPVIFISNPRNWLFNTVLVEILFSNSIIPETFVIIRLIINTPAIKETYIVNSGLYCFKIIITISAINPIPNYFYDIHN